MDKYLNNGFLKDESLYFKVIHPCCVVKYKWMFSFAISQHKIYIQ
jgi:hypothetical protein